MSKHIVYCFNMQSFICSVTQEGGNCLGISLID